jgi:hypothetical protein
LDKIIETELLTSLITIVVVILAVAVFIKYRAGMLFYSLVVLALAIGLLNAWLIATLEVRGRGAHAASGTARKKRRRKSR